MTPGEQSRPIVVATILMSGVACGLLVLSGDVADPARAAVRDGLRPGQIWFGDALAAMKSTVRNWADDSAIPGRRKEPLDDADAPAAGSSRRIRRLELANALLREQLHRNERIGRSPYRGEASEPLTSADLISARVLGEETAGLWRSGYLLDGGSRSGLAESDLVLQDDAALVDVGEGEKLETGFAVFAGRCVVGRIRNVGRWTSTIEPVAAIGFRGRAQLVRKTERGFAFGAIGVIEGTGEGDCNLTMIPAAEPVAVGDDVYTISDGGVFPFPMYYGRIVRADLPATASLWTIRVEPAAETARPRTVQILRRRLNPKRLARGG